jgi:hypothetical protein
MNANTAILFIFVASLTSQLIGCEDKPGDTQQPTQDTDTDADTDADADTDSDADSDADADADADSDADTDTAVPYAEDITSFPLDCETDGSLHQDILTATAVTVGDPEGDPQVEVRWEKCDGSAFSGTKTCYVHVGTYMPYGVDRHIYETGSDSFTWSSGQSHFITTFDGWPSSSPFGADSCGAIKEFFVVCDDSSAHPDHWYSSDPVTIEKICP